MTFTFFYSASLLFFRSIGLETSRVCFNNSVVKSSKKICTGKKIFTPKNIICTWLIRWKVRVLQVETELWKQSGIKKSGSWNDDVFQNTRFYYIFFTHMWIEEKCWWDDALKNTYWMHGFLLLLELLYNGNNNRREKKTTQ